MSCFTSAGNKYSLERRSEFFSLQGGGRLFFSNIAENGCCAKAQGIASEAKLRTTGSLEQEA
jgi:hypothetical protein